MVRFALKFCAGLLAAAVAACIVAPEAAPPPPAPPPVVTAPRTAVISQECRSLGIDSGRSFIVSKVRYGPFDPSTTAGKVPFLNMTPLGPDEQSALDLAAAFEAAPQSFQTQLCQLDGVIVNTRDCGRWDPTCTADPHANSWGLREKKERNPESGRQFIAVSYALWYPTQPKLSSFQNTVLDSLLAGWTDTQTKPSITNSGGPGAGDDTDIMTFLAVLAHEFGHVLWYDTMDPNRDPNYPVNENWCRSIPFFQAGWSSQPLKPPMWRNFAGENPDNNYQGSAFATLRENIRNGAWNNAKNTLRFSIYNDGLGNGLAYPSLFGAYSPDEDFVETFTLAVLLKAQNGHQLQNLNLHIPGGQNINLAARAGGQGQLARKIACFHITG